jgi:hypothetical protein
MARWRSSWVSKSVRFGIVVAFGMVEQDAMVWSLRITEVLYLHRSHAVYDVVSVAAIKLRFEYRIKTGQGGLLILLLLGTRRG